VISFQGETKAYHGSVLVLVPHIDSSIILGRLGESILGLSSGSPAVLS